MSQAFFLKFEGPDIEGGSTAKGYENQIELISFSHSASQPTGGSRSSGGKSTIEQATHDPVMVVKEIDTTTPELQRICWSGDHLDKATLSCVASTGGKTSEENLPYFKIELEDVVIQNHNISGSPGSAGTESFAMSYGKITTTYGKSDSQGQKQGDIPASHDLRTKDIA